MTSMIERESRRANERRVERADEIVELVETPVGVLAREPRVDETLFVCAEIYAGMGNADDQRRCAAPDHEPVGMLGHRAASTPGNSAAPAASMIAPSRTRSIAACISGWK